MAGPTRWWYSTRTVERHTSFRCVPALCALAAVLVVFALGCARDDGYLRIGGVLSLSGAAYYLGGEVRDGAQLAIDEINEWGGVDGRKLQLIVQDSASNPQIGKKAFQQIEEKYHPLFFISTSSTVTVALIPLAEAIRSVLVGLVVTTPQVPGSSQWAFRYYPTAEDDIAPIIPVLELLKVRTLGVLHLDDEFGTSIFEVLRREAGAIGVEVTGISYPTATADFAPFLEKLSGFDAAYLNGFIPNLEAIYEQLSRNPLKIPVFSNNASAIPRVRAYPAANGVYVGAPVIYNEGFRFAAETRRKYESRYRKPFNHYAANGYDLIKLVAGLLEGSRGDRDALRETLSTEFMYSGILGELSTKSGGRGMSFPLLPARIVDGGIEYLNLDIPASVVSASDTAEASR